MKHSLRNFPILGSTCSAVLSAAANPKQTWVLARIETLADLPAHELGDIWRRVQIGPLTLTTDALCAALNLASQVVTLDVQLTEDPSIELLIEDGVTIECRLN